MRVLLLTHRLPFAPNRGDRIRAYHLARTLSSRHEVHLVSFVHDDDEEQQAAALRSMAASIATVRVAGWTRFAAAGAALPTRTPLTHVLLHSRDMSPLLARTRQSVRPDVVLAYCTGMARYAMEPPLAGLPWVLDMVDVDSAKWAALAQSAKPWLRPVYAREARLLGAFERDAMSRASATTVVSEKERATLAEMAPGRNVHVIPNGIDCGSFAPSAPPAGRPEVVFCGVFNYEPNAAGAIWLADEVWPRVVRAVPDATLSLVGMHPTAAVRALANDRVRVTGEVPDVRPYLWNAAVGVAPLQIARGVQNKVLEALAAGLPSVVTPAVFAGLPDAVHAGCRVAADPAAFADAIVQLLAEAPERRRAIASGARLHALSWEGQLEPMQQLLEAAKRAQN